MPGRSISFIFFGTKTKEEREREIEVNESELFPLIEVVLGTGMSIFIMILLLTTVFTLIRKIPKVDNKNTTLICSIIIVIISIPMLLSQIFN